MATRQVTLTKFFPSFLEERGPVALLESPTSGDGRLGVNLIILGVLDGGWTFAFCVDRTEGSPSVSTGRSGVSSSLSPFLFSLVSLLVSGLVAWSRSWF